MSSEASPAAPAHGLSAHRIDALSDGIYAVAMTLLVIELKVPDAHALHTDREVLDALAELAPRFLAWMVSFGVMGMFWLGHHRAHDHLRSVDSTILWLNLGQLAGVSLMPFSCALQGAQGGVAGQAVFAVNMMLLAVCSLLLARHIHRHPALCARPMSDADYRGVRLRVGGLIVISGSTVALQALLPDVHGAGNVAFVLTAVLGRVSRRGNRAGVPGRIESRG